VAASEREYPLIHFGQGPIQGPLRDTVASWVEPFEPLDFEAGRKAKAWLETNLSAELLPLDTYFVFNDRKEDELFGFMALADAEVRVAPGDLPIMQIRQAIDDPEANHHPATKLVWIARSKSSPRGLGSELFDYALLVATRAKKCALMVDAFDEPTAEELWIRHYDLRKPRDGGEEWSSLWHAVGKADQTFG
jgi:hypothetical protein